MKNHLHTAALCLSTLAALTATPATAATQPLAGGAVFWLGDAAYQSSADIPAGFYAGGAPTLLENFEDRSLDNSLAASRGWLSGAGQANSVDADDGAQDNHGLLGVNWLAPSGLDGLPIRFSFIGDTLPTSFGLVLTAAGRNTTFSAFDDGGLLIATQTFNLLGLDSGVVSDDRFVGLQYAPGIRSIEVNVVGGWLEVDHVQYGQMAAAAAAVPEPGSWALMMAGGLAGWAGWARRRAAANRLA